MRFTNECLSSFYLQNSGLRTASVVVSQEEGGRGGGCGRVRLLKSTYPLFTC